MIKIPFFSNSEDAEPLRKAVCKAAYSGGVTEFQLALLMAHFLEAVAQRVVPFNRELGSGTATTDKLSNPKLPKYSPCPRRAD
jgi:hypothetical protein